MVLFSFYLRMKIPSSQMISDTSTTSPPCPNPPKRGFYQDFPSFGSIITSYQQPHSVLRGVSRVREEGSVYLLLYFSRKWNRVPHSEELEMKSCQLKVQPACSVSLSSPLINVLSFTVLLNDVLQATGLARRHLYHGQLLSFLRIR